ncbi:MAG: hypothetical protein WCJ02_05125 [bacterium]
MNRMIGAMLGIFTIVGFSTQSARAQSATANAGAEIAKAVEQAVSEALSQAAGSPQVISKPVVLKPIVKVVSVKEGAAQVTPEMISEALKDAGNGSDLQKSIQDALSTMIPQATTSVSVSTPTVKVITIDGKGSAGDISRAINDALNGMANDPSVKKALEQAVEEASKQVKNLEEASKKAAEDKK